MLYLLFVFFTDIGHEQLLACASCILFLFLYLQKLDLASTYNISLFIFTCYSCLLNCPFFKQVFLVYGI